MTRRRGRPGGTDDGSVTLEVLLVSLLLLIPSLYLVVTLSRIQSAAFAADSAARDGVRAVLLADTSTGLTDRVESLATMALADQGFTDATAAAVLLHCDNDPCLQPGGQVTTTIVVDVALPLFPVLPGADRPPSVAVSATSTGVVDPYRRPR